MAMTAELSINPLPGTIAELLTNGKRTRIATSPVSHAAIHDWCDAIGIANPRYTGQEGNVYDLLVAPPPMLQSWAGQRLGSVRSAAHPAAIHCDVRKAFREAGFPSVVATNYEQTYIADLHPGDVVEEESWIEEVSSKKLTRLGMGHFAKIGFTFRKRDTQELVGRQLATTFYYLPSDEDLSAGTSGTAIEDLDRPLTLNVTPTLVIAGALASNDYEKVHHDLQSAQADGLRDIILSIVTSAGMVMRYLVDDLMPDHRLVSLRLRLGVPGFPGDTLRLSSRLMEKTADGVSLQVRGNLERGVHIEANASLVPI